MNRWRELVEILRNIYATEHNIIHNYKLSTEERIQAVHKYIIEGNEDEYRVYLLDLSAIYLEYKPKQKEIEAEINMLMEQKFKN